MAYAIVIWCWSPFPEWRVPKPSFPMSQMQFRRQLDPATVLLGAGYARPPSLCSMLNQESSGEGGKMATLPQPQYIYQGFRERILTLVCAIQTQPFLFLNSGFFKSVDMIWGSYSVGREREGCGERERLYCYENWRSVIFTNSNLGVLWEGKGHTECRWEQNHCRASKTKPMFRRWLCLCCLLIRVQILAGFIGLVPCLVMLC